VGLKDDLEAQVKETFRLNWDEDGSEKVPVPADLRLNANHAKKLDEAIVLYADIDSSTAMVDTLTWQKAAEIYKTYLHCASRLLRSEGATITAYDGDRVMAVWPKNNRTAATRAALKINYAVEEIIRPAYAKQYPHSSYTLKHVIGIDLGALHAARIGVRGDNDVVWVGRAANHAAKLCAKSDWPIWITKSIYDGMKDETKYAAGTNMWTRSTWLVGGEYREVYSTIYRTSF
jgi:class 3 adenylate cyclase